MYKSILRLGIFFGLLFASHIAFSCPLCKGEKIKIGRFWVQQQCINIGNCQLYMQIVGEAGPTIIFESGLGDPSGGWNKVISQVAKFSRTVAYDRVGLGRSQNKGTITRTAQYTVDNLRLLLQKAHLFPPYILVGHSLGGLYMQLFAQQHPREVLGVVLVDSATAEQSSDQQLPPEDAPHYLEAKGLKSSIEQVKTAPHFPPIPLVILTSGQRGKEWIKLQERLVVLSPKSHHIVTYESGHHIQNEQPDLVINSIRDMVTSVQKIQEAHSVFLVREFIAARTTHDVKGVLKPFADDVIWKTSWGETLRGKQALKKMLIKQFQDNITNEIVGAPQVNNNKIKLLRKVTMESWKKQGIDYLMEDTEVVIKNNKIVYWKSQYTPESIAKLQQHQGKNK